VPTSPTQLKLVHLLNSLLQYAHFLNRFLLLAGIAWREVQEESIALNLLSFLSADAPPMEALDLGLKTADSEEQTLWSVQVQMKDFGASPAKADQEVYKLLFSHISSICSNLWKKELLYTKLKLSSRSF